MAQYVDREVAQRLLREAPPEYISDSISEPQEQFEIEEEGSVNDNDSTNWFDSMKWFSHRRIGRPVSRVVDPLVKCWYVINKQCELLITRHFNPFIFKRGSVLVAVSLLIIFLHYNYTWIDSRPTHRSHGRLSQIITDTISKERIQHTSEFLAKMPHLAGSQADAATSQYIYDTFDSLGLHAQMNKNNVFLSHGNHEHRNSTLLELRNLDTGEIEFSSSLNETNALNAGLLGLKQPPTQMALVLPGDAKGHLVYAHFGSDQDFNSVDCRDSIVLVQYGMESPGDIAIRAQALGVRGLLFMSTKASGEPMWPLGRDYPMEAVQQGSMGSYSTFPGDILSPGWPSSDQMKVNLDNAYIATIPAAAISWRDAEPLLRSLRGSGKRVDLDWGNNNGVPDLEEWWTGPSSRYEVHLVTTPVIEERHTIQNVFGSLKGHEDSHYIVMIGARMDTMCYGTSQLSGLNVLLEVARTLALLSRKEHWQPLRSIYFALWDGTTSNYAGSTEWVESMAEALRLQGISYIDLDVGISGPQLLVRGNPIFDLSDTLKHIVLDGEPIINNLHPKSGYPMSKYGNALGFEAHTGVPSIQLGFVDSVKPVPVDSCFDNIEWMSKFGDPNWERHEALARIVTNFALELADGPMLPFDFSRLGSVGLTLINDISSRWRSTFENSQNDQEVEQSFKELETAANKIVEVSGLYNQAKHDWQQYYNTEKDPLTGDIPILPTIAQVRRYWNERALLANKALCDINGINHRNWYKNHMFGPSRNQNLNDDLSGGFPGIQDAIADKDRDGLLKALRDATSHVTAASSKLLEIIA